MFRKRKQEPQAAKSTVKLTAAEKREIRRILETARGDGKPHSAQDTTPFWQMYPDGLCRLDDTTWSRCLEFEDVNYQLAQQDDQTAIFEALCDMYNAHDASIGMELSLVCRKVNKADFRKRIEIAAQEDKFDAVCALYTDMLRGQLEHGNNGMVKTKFLVLTIEAKNSKEAKARFSRITLDALNYFKAMGALAKVLDGKEWLEVLHGILHPDGEPFPFAWEWLAPSGLSVKDFIAPSSFRFGEARRFQMGGKVGAWSVEIWKRFRKWGGIPTGITQNIKDLLASAEIENIFENSDFIYLLNQASGDRKILCERLNISTQQAAHISNSGPGEGPIFFGNVILPFVDHFPTDNELYSIMIYPPR